LSLENALLYGFLTGLPLIGGAILTKFASFGGKTLGAIMAFGSGALIVVITFSLMSESYENGGIVVASVGFISGVILFSTGNYFINKRGGKRRKQCSHPQEMTHDPNSEGKALALGSLMDNIPESLALGVSAISGTVGIAFLAGIIVSNFSESVASSQTMKIAKMNTKSIVITWSAIGMANMVSAAIGFLVLSQLGSEAIAFALALAAGAILAMLSETMIPEAYRHGGFFISFATALGFLMSFALVIA